MTTRSAPDEVHRLASVQAPGQFSEAKKESQSQPRDPVDFSQTREANGVGGLEDEEENRDLDQTQGHEADRSKEAFKTEENEAHNIDDRNSNEWVQDEREQDQNSIEVHADDEPTSPNEQQRALTDEGMDLHDETYDSEERERGKTRADDLNPQMTGSKTPGSSSTVRELPDQITRSKTQFEMLNVPQKVSSKAPPLRPQEPNATLAERQEWNARQASSAPARVTMDRISSEGVLRTTSNAENKLSESEETQIISWSDLEATFEREIFAKEQEEETQQADFENLLNVRATRHVLF